MLVSHNAICFGCFMPLSHGVNKEAHPVASFPPLPLTRFSTGFFVLQAILYLHFALVRLLQKIIHFQNELIFFSQLIAGWF